MTYASQVIGASFPIPFGQNFREADDHGGWALNGKTPTVDLFGDLIGAALEAENPDEPDPAIQERVRGISSFLAARRGIDVSPQPYAPCLDTGHYSDLFGGQSPLSQRLRSLLGFLARDPHLAISRLGQRRRQTGYLPSIGFHESAL